MARTFRNIVADAYRKSGVVGIGQTMRPEQLTEGMAEVNLILKKVYARNKGAAVIATPVLFTGVANYTIGPEQETGPQPDIILGVMPNRIDQITIFNGARTTCYPIDPLTYNERSLDNIESNTPYYFYFERVFPLGVIRFYNGSPSGNAELVYKPLMVDVTPNTDFSVFPTELEPYIHYELSNRIAGSNGFESRSLKKDSDDAWSDYISNTAQKKRYMADGSAPGRTRTNNYNIYAGPTL